MTVLATSANVFSTVVKYELAPELGICRKALTVYDAASTYAVGAVLGRFLASPTGTAGSIVGTGNGVMGTVTVTGKAQIGTYTLRINKAASNAGDFTLSNPQGVVVGNGTVAVAFVSPDMTFTLADGATDFVIGDTIPIVVAGTEKYKLVEATATDGTDKAAAIFIADKAGNSGSLAITATTDTTVLALVKGPARVSKSSLSFGASVDTAAELAKAYAELEALGINVDTTV